MPTSAREEVANSPKASVKAVHSARADVGIGPYRIWCEFAGDFGKIRCSLRADGVVHHYKTGARQKAGCTDFKRIFGEFAASQLISKYWVAFLILIPHYVIQIPDC